MKPIKFIFTSLLVAAAWTFVACNDDDKDYTAASPVFDQLELSTPRCYPGDSIFATATIKTEGAYYYYFRLYYTVAGVTNVIDKGDIVNKSGEVKFAFRAPSEPGSYPVSFKATVSYYSGNQIYGETNSVNTTLHVLEGFSDGD